MGMRTPWLFLFFALLGFRLMSASSSAQLIVRVKLEHERVVKYEPIIARLMIQNQTSHSLTIGGEGAEAHLECSIRQLRGSFVSGYPDKPFPVMEVPRNTTVTNELNLLHYFDLRRAGCYAVEFQIQWSGKSFAPGKVYLDVLEGAEIHSMVDYVEEAQGFLKYSLISMNRESGERLFLNIEDEEKKLCYAMYDIGPSLRLYKPSLLIDTSGFVHILHQSAPTRMIHSIFGRDGQIVQQEFYRFAGGQPRLQEQPDGAVIVQGATLIEVE
ncbi:MAG: hypothetical protein EOM20_02610 [Spartobacteria bacterium]|nr:hypothetical protein [Spartobacteria bacterium]